jgi:SPP1 gp7 family putative phage head morphogenesis protein
MNLLPVTPPYIAAAWLKSKKPAVYDSLLAKGANEYDHKYNFYVAHVGGLDQVKIVKGLLDKALTKDGFDFQTWRDKLQAKDIELPHATTVWRTNIFSALNEGRYARFIESADDAPYLLYESVEDEKTRPNHAANNGLCMHINDPAWEGHVPPLGFNCRCILLNLEAKEVAGRQKLSAPPSNGAPDSPEWGHSPFTAAKKSIKPDADDILKSADVSVTSEWTRQLEQRLSDAPTLLNKDTAKIAEDIKNTLPDSYGWFKKLTQKEQEVLAWYSTKGAAEFRKFANEIEAFQFGDREVAERMAATVKLLSDTIKKIPEASLKEGVSLVAPSEKALANRAYINPAWSGKPSDRYAAFTNKLENLKAGDVVEFNGAQSYNAMDASFARRPDVEFLITKNLTGKYLGQASYNYSPGAEDEIVYWSPRLKFVHKEIVPHTKKVIGRPDNFTRYYFEEVTIAATITLASIKSELIDYGSTFNLFGQSVNDWMIWV